MGCYSEESGLHKSFQVKLVKCYLVMLVKFIVYTPHLVAL